MASPANHRGIHSSGSCITCNRTTVIVPAIQGFDPFILLKLASRIFGVSSSKALEAILPSPVVINLKMFSVAPNLQTHAEAIPF